MPGPVLPSARDVREHARVIYGFLEAVRALPPELVTEDVVRTAHGLMDDFEVLADYHAAVTRLGVDRETAALVAALA